MPQLHSNVTTPIVVCEMKTACTMFCFMSSEKPVQYTWSKDGKPVKGIDVTIIDNVLLVTPRAAEDYGVYVCTATNTAGRVEYNITLKEESKSSTSREESKGNKNFVFYLLHGERNIT